MFKFKTKIISQNSAIVVYSRESFFLNLFIYHFLLEKHQKVYLITPDKKKIEASSAWSFFRGHPQLHLFQPAELVNQTNKIKSEIEFFFDLSFLGWHEHLGLGLEDQVEASFGLLQRLAINNNLKTKYILLAPMIYNLKEELKLYHQLKHQEFFLWDYSRIFHLDYQLIQLPNYLYPDIFLRRPTNFLGQVINCFLAGQSLPWSAETKLYVADQGDEIQFLEEIAFGFSKVTKASLLTKEMRLGEFLSSLADHLQLKITPSFQPKANLPEPILIGDVYQKEIKVDRDFLKLKQSLDINLATVKNRKCPQNDQIENIEVASSNQIKPPTINQVLTSQKKSKQPSNNTSLSLNKFSSLLEHLSRIKLSRPQKWPYFLMFFLASLLATFSLLAVLLFSFKNGVTQAVNCPTKATKRDCERSVMANLDRVEKINKFFIPLFRLAGLSATSDRINDVTNFFRLSQQTNRTLESLPNEETEFLAYVFNRQNNENDFNFYYSHLNDKYRLLENDVDEAIALYRAHQNEYQGLKLWQLNKKLEASYHYLTNLRQRLMKTNKVIKISPVFLGVKKRKDYLVVFVDNNELRPGGGLIVAYAKLSFEDGQLVDSHVFDIYQLDNQLKGDISPPTPLAVYLGQANWHLRDAAWQANYPDTARQISWFYQKITGQNIDGVIMINDDFMAKILSIWPEFYLPDLHLKLTKKNLKHQLFLWGDLEKGNQNTIFISLLKSFISHLQNLNGPQANKLLTIIGQSGQTKDFLFYSDNNLLADFLASFQLDGLIKKPSCQSNCLLVGGLLTEANMSANRVNYLLKQQLSLKLNLGKNSLNQELALVVENPSISPKWPGGDYKDYFQLYVDKNWRLKDVELAGQKLNLASLDVATQSGLHIYRLFHQVGYNQRQSLVFHFSRPYKWEKKLDLLFWQPKQPGLVIKKDLLQLNFSRGTNVKVISPVDWFKASHQIIYQTVFDKDLLIPVRLKLR